MTRGCSHHCQLLELFLVLAWGPEGQPVSEVLNETGGGARHCPQGFPSEKTQVEEATGSPHHVRATHVMCSAVKDGTQESGRSVPCPGFVVAHGGGRWSVSLTLSLSSPNPHEVVIGETVACL